MSIGLDCERVSCRASPWLGARAATYAVETLLSAATEHAALLVMGGYGHSRLREWIFGGFTLHVLRAAAVPVLMAH